MKRAAWLVLKYGPRTGTRYPLRDAVTRVGRASDNDVVLTGELAVFVSGRHFEIRNENGAFRLADLNSTNGTFVDGDRVSAADLKSDHLIQLGAAGPLLAFELEDPAEPEADRTLTFPAESAARSERKVTPIDAENEELLSAAVHKARKARLSGNGDQTAIIMREMMGKVIRRSNLPLKRIIWALVLSLAGLAGFSAWRIATLKKEQVDIDDRIRAIEARLGSGIEDTREIDQLLDQLNQFQAQARALQTSIFYQLGVRSSEQDFVEGEIRRLMAEFGAEAYSIPPEFVTQVHRYIRQYQERDRAHMQRALGRARPDLERVRSSIREQNLPQDLAYMVLVESAFITRNESPAGAVGLWQFTPETARAYGLRVDGQTDERLDIDKSTRAAGRYIRELILDFGTGSSVMLALAAYNLGPGRVKQAVRKVSDPIKQRNFWYLYRVRALPQETREYVPKIIAAIVIGRNPERFGFA